MICWLLVGDSKEQVLRIIQEAEAMAYSLAKHLPDSEVASLLEELSFDQVWDRAMESENDRQMEQFFQGLVTTSEQLRQLGNKLEETDHTLAATLRQM